MRQDNRSKKKHKRQSMCVYVSMCLLDFFKVFKCFYEAAEFVAACLAA